MDLEKKHTLKWGKDKTKLSKKKNYVRRKFEYFNVGISWYSDYWKAFLQLVNY